MDKVTKEEAQADIKRYKSIEAIANQEGGKIVLSALRRDVVADIEKIIGSYDDEEMKLRSAVVKLKADLGLLRIFTRAKSLHKMAADALEEIEKEELGE